MSPDRTPWDDPQQGLGGDAADAPLPGLEAHGVGPGAPRGSSRPERLDGVSAESQGAVLREDFETHYEAWIESLRRSQMPGAEPFGAHDPFPLRGGEVCDRCEQLAMLATEHVWTPEADEVPPELRTLGVSDTWRSGVLLWCARHAREHQLRLLSGGAVVVGLRGR